MGPSGVVASWVETIIRKRVAELLLLRQQQRPKDFGLPCGQHDFQILNQRKGLIRRGGLLLLGYEELRLFPREVSLLPDEFFLGLFWQEGFLQGRFFLELFRTSRLSRGRWHLFGLDSLYKHLSNWELGSFVRVRYPQHTGFFFKF